MAGGESYGGITVPKGDPGALEASAGRLVSTAGLLQSFSGHLNGVLGALSWFGPASAQHSLLTGTQTLMANTSATALLQQASVINGYAQILDAAQRQATRAIERAKDADERIKQAEEDIQQAVDDQAAANLRILAAQAAQSRVFSSAVDLLSGSAAAMADWAAAEEADARRDLHAAEERERQARRRLEAAEEDRREAQQDGLDAEEAVSIARVSLVAAAQGAGLLPTAPGGPANPAFAAAAGITLPTPPEPEEDDRSWFERRLDDVGNAASWTWDQAQQVPGGAWEGVQGLYEGGKFLVELNPTNPWNWRDPGAMIDRYEQLGQAGQFAWEHPGEFGKALINYEDLAAGRYGEWAGNLLPDAIAAVATGGAGAVVTRGTRIVRATDKLSDASQAYRRAVDIKSEFPTQRWRDRKTVASHAGDDGSIAISGDAYKEQARVLRSMGLDPDLLKRTDPQDMKSGMKAAADHDMPSHPWDRNRFDGYYYSTHSEIRLLLDEPTRPVGVSKAPCAESCDPGIQNLATSLKEDILVQSSPDGATLYRKDGEVIPNVRPDQFSGVNSRWPGALWGAGGGAAAVGASAGGP